jgi:hypothetical protein
MDAQETQGKNAVSERVSAKSGMNILQRWIDLLGISADKLRSEFPRSQFEADPNSVYGGLPQVALLRNEDGLFYFDKDKLILIHIHSPAILSKLDAQSLLSELGTPEAELNSRAGKGYTQYAFPKRGIAFSSDSDDQIAFVEIFVPMTLDDYLAHVYVDPGPFVR